MKNADRAKTVQRPCKWRTKRKSHEESYDSSWDFGALEGTRIPGPLIKSQMLYRLSYERIFCSNTILPNNITINADKMQVPGRKFLRCTYEVPRGDFKRPNGLAAGEMEVFSRQVPLYKTGQNRYNQSKSDLGSFPGRQCLTPP